MYLFLGENTDLAAEKRGAAVLIISRLDWMALGPSLTKSIVKKSYVIIISLITTVIVIIIIIIVIVIFIIIF